MASIAGVVAMLTVAGVAGVVVAPVSAVAQSASSIVVEGNRRVDAETIRSYFQSKPGEPLT
ncbi:cell division septal protein FtsQ, partial [Angulomicrobium amanitiforme]|nr:cell division septal protein FtsQ [Ancylobacter amanitiformis]